jgi:hypothetical protein
MKTLTLLAAAAFAVATPALAQQSVTTQRVLPNGDVHTSTVVHDGGMGMSGGMNRPDMDRRMDGRDRMEDHRERTVVSERVVTDHGRGWHRGHHARRVCVTRMHHHERVRRCWMRHG